MENADAIPPKTAIGYKPMLDEVHFDFELNGKKYAQIPKKQSKSFNEVY